MSYPTSLDDLSSSRASQGTDKLSLPNHLTHHIAEDSAIQALEAKVGVNSSAVATSIDYLLKHASSINPGHKHNFLSALDGDPANAVYVDDSGNVGIGTTEPGYGLHVAKDVLVPLSIERTTATANDQLTELGFRGNRSGSGDTPADIARIGAAYSDNTSGSADGYLVFETRNNGSIGERVRINKDGNVGIGTTSPTNLLSLGGESARVFWMEREQTANTPGNTLTVQAGGATVAATDKAGGDLVFQPGVSTGSAESGVQIKGCVAGAGGTADRTLTTVIRALGNKIGFYNIAPVARQVLATGLGATVDNVITALQNLGLVAQS